MSALPVPEKSELARCEAIIEAGQTTFVAVGNALLTIREKRLYRETHATFDDYTRDRWGWSRTHAYRLIDAFEVVQDLSPIGDKPTAEAQVRPLVQLPPAERPAAWKEAVEETNGQPTAKAVQKVVDRKLGKPEKPTPPPPPAPAPAPAPTSKVNGAAAADPPDVAALRAAGKIPAAAVVEIYEPEPDDVGETVEDVRNDHAEAAGKADELSDDEWLATLPLSGALEALPLRKFAADALHFRRLEPIRRDFANRVVRVKPSRLAGDGVVAYRTRNYVKLAHPKHWIRCAAVEHGGCGGTGEVPFVGQCPKCFGRGYWVK